MAIKIRCHQCHKRISIDVGFAGGYCRCPYCTAITRVPGGAESAVAALARPTRPETPELPGAGPPASERPEFPGAPAPGETPAPEGQEAVPLASPVFVQGVVALILSALLALMVGGAIVVYLSWGRPGKGAPARDAAADVPAQVGEDAVAPPAREALFTLKGIRAAGMEFTPPVVYVVDASSGMSEFYDPAAAVVRYSVRSLGGEHKFNVVLVREEGVKSLAEGWAAGGEDGDARAQKFFQSYQPIGATDLKNGLRRALDAAPSTIVLLAAKEIAQPESLIEQARGSGVAIFAVSLGAYAQATKALKALAEGTGGKWRQFKRDELLEELGKAPPLP